MGYEISALVGIALVLLWEICTVLKGCLSQLQSIDRELTELRREADYRAREL